MTLGESRFVEIYESHYRRVHLFCRRRVEADQVDDAVAETFLAAWRKIDQVPGGEAALLWLYAAARRVVLHSWRGDPSDMAIAIEYVAEFIAQSDFYPLSGS